MAEATAEQQLNQEIFSALAELLSRFMAEGERLAAEYGLPLFAVKALHWLDDGMAMKDVGRRLRCDPSFVTAIADSLEQRGLARRAPCPADRRVKNLVLTEEGRDLRARFEDELLARMPWARELSLAERRTLLGVLRKLAGPAPCPVAPHLAATAKEVSS